MTDQYGHPDVHPVHEKHWGESSQPMPGWVVLAAPALFVALIVLGVMLG